MASAALAAHKLDRMFRPRNVVFIGGGNLKPTMRYQREMGFAGETWIVNPKYDEIEGYRCYPTVADLPGIPDLAFVAVRNELAIEVTAQLREAGCSAIVCNAAGFAETGPGGVALQERFVETVGDMAALGPNSAGFSNYIDPLGVMMDNFGTNFVSEGAAIVSQGGNLLCDAVFSDRGLPITHLVGCGNQAVTSVTDCIDYFLEDPRVKVIGLSFEGLPYPSDLRKVAVKALKYGKPIVAIKFGRTKAGANASASHTASMTGDNAAWEALFDRLGIVSVASDSEFFETLKLFASGQVPKGRRVLVTSLSGILGILLADNLSDAGFELIQPTGARVDKLRDLLPAIATPCNPQDMTMAVWANADLQVDVYSALLEEGYDIALMIQNYPREGTWDMSDFKPQVEALARAVKGRDVVAAELATLVDCFPATARNHTAELDLVPLQGLKEGIAALAHGVRWYERRAALLTAGSDALLPGAVSQMQGDPIRLNEAEAKSRLAAYGLSVPECRVVAPEDAAMAAAEIGFPMVLKALDATLAHKTEAGAVCIGLDSAAAVGAAVQKMRQDLASHAPSIVFDQVLVEHMVGDVVAEIMVSVTRDPLVGQVMMVAAGGVDAELWNDSTLIASPFTRFEIGRALDRLKIAKRLAGWRGRPEGDREALLDALEAVGRFALAEQAVEIEINPILVSQNAAVAADAVAQMPDQTVKP